MTLLLFWWHNESSFRSEAFLRRFDANLERTSDPPSLGEPMRLLFCSLSLAALPSIASTAPQGESPEAWDWRAAIEHVLPEASETAWMGLPWEPSLRAGLVAGRQQAKPVLLWAMNGHPLAST